jgi:hypothetical protein
VSIAPRCTGTWRRTWKDPEGGRPANLPRERTRKYELLLNLGTAQALGLTVPKSILEQATEIFQEAAATARQGTCRTPALVNPRLTGH